MRKNWSKIEGAFNKLHISYIFFSAIMAVIFYVVILGLISHTILRTIINVQLHISIIITSFLVAFLFLGANYFTTNAKKCFKNLALEETSKNYYDKLYMIFEKKLRHSIGFYLILVLVIFLYIFPPPQPEYFISYYENSVPSNLFDIITWLATFFIIYMITTILWIILNVSLALDRMHDDSSRDYLKIDLFSGDKTGGLRSIRDLILYISVFQFIVIMLIVIQFYLGKGEFSFESIFFTILFLITVLFFFRGLNTIYNIIEDARKQVVLNINHLIQQQDQRAFDILSKGDYENNNERFDQLSKSINWLQNERDQAMDASRRTYDLKTILVFISSSLLPIIAAISNQVAFFASNPFKQELANQTMNFMMNYTNYTMQVFR